MHVCIHAYDKGSAMSQLFVYNLSHPTLNLERLLALVHAFGFSSSFSLSLSLFLFIALSVSLSLSLPSLFPCFSLSLSFSFFRSRCWSLSRYRFVFFLPCFMFFFRCSSFRAIFRSFSFSSVISFFKKGTRRKIDRFLGEGVYPPLLKSTSRFPIKKAFL